MEAHAMSLGLFLRTLSGAVSDVFGKPLRRLALFAAAVAIPLLAAATWAAIHFLAPLIPDLHGPFSLLTGALKLVLGLGAFWVALLLWPAVSMLIGAALFDVAAARVEQAHFPSDAPGKPPRFSDGAAHGLRYALPTLALNLIALPFLLFPGLNVIVFLGLNAYLTSRDYFSMAALRFRTPKEVMALRTRHAGELYVAGLACAALLLVPVVNFVTPLFGAALMVRLNKAMG